MEKSFENRWCKYCMVKTEHEIIFLPHMLTYRRRRQFKCTKCGKKIWLPGRKPSAESVY